MGNPASAAADIFGSAVDQAKEETLRQRNKLEGVVEEFAQHTDRAKRTKNVSQMAKLEQFGRKLLAALIAFATKAIEIAIYKFVLELCAMIIKSMMEMIATKGGQRLDITTPGVHYATPGSNNAYANNVSPFDSGHYNRASSSIPW